MFDAPIGTANIIRVTNDGSTSVEQRPPGDLEAGPGLAETPIFECPNEPTEQSGVELIGWVAVALASVVVLMTVAFGVSRRRA